LVPDESKRITLATEADIAKDNGDLQYIQPIEVPAGRWQLDIRLEGLITITTPSSAWPWLNGKPFGPGGPVPDGSYPYPWYMATWVHYTPDDTGELQWIYVPSIDKRGPIPVLTAQVRVQGPGVINVYRYLATVFPLGAHGRGGRR
jgi:hypothetical protein